MLYVVECAYTDPQSEAAWNTFTIRKNYRRWSLCPVSTPPSASALLARAAPATALHDIHDATVIDSDAYRRNGGGHFARWQSAIADWHRHLYLTNNTLREVAPDEVLLLGDTAEDLPVAAPILLQPRPGDRTKPVCRHPPTRQPASRPRLPPSLSISPSPPGYATRRSAREVAMSPAPFIR